METSEKAQRSYGGGHRLKEGELKENSSADFFACLAHSLFDGKHSATYKFGFLKSLLDNLFSSEKGDNGLFYLDLRTIASTFVTIYWNAVVLYDIPQMPMTSEGKTSGIARVFKDMLAANQLLKAPFESLRTDVKIEAMKKAYPVFKENVIGAFYYDTDGLIYGFSKKENRLWLNQNSMDFLSRHKSLIDQVNYYEWLKMCEKILKDHGLEPIPYLSTKLEEITKRVNLQPFKEALERDCGGNNICFYCGKPLRKGEGELDHVIPWSFIKSDPEWNFVFACRSCNNGKRDSIPSTEYLNLVQKRNERFNLGNHDMRALARIAAYNGVKTGWKPKKG